MRAAVRLREGNFSCNNVISWITIVSSSWRIIYIFSLIYRPFFAGILSTGLCITYCDIYIYLCIIYTRTQTQYRNLWANVVYLAL